MLGDGIVQGDKTKETQTTIAVEMSDPPTKLIQKGIETEAARLAGFLNTVVVLEYDPSK